MRTFVAQTYGNTAMGGHPGSLRSQVGGFRAPGPGVLVVEEGTIWVARPDGSRQILAAKSVVEYETNEWVEYGGDGPSSWRVRDYWAAMEPFEDAERRQSEIFGPAASS